MDFVSDSLEYGRRLKCLTIVDDYTKEAIDIPVDHGISGEYVTRVLDQVGQFRGLPQVIQTDQGPEFTGNALGYQTPAEFAAAWRARHTGHARQEAST
jgi:putative transposase